MRDVSWWEAWSLWWDGESTQSLRIAGHPLYQWARIAKTVVLVAVLPLLVELIGADKVRGFGERMRDLAKSRRGARLWAAFQQHHDVIVGVGSGVAVVAACLAVVLLVLGAVFDRFGESLSTVSDFLINTVAAWTLVGTLAFVLLVGLLTVLAVVVELVVIRPITWALMSPRFEWTTKGLALVLLVSGSCVDLLATG